MWWPPPVRRSSPCTGGGTAPTCSPRRSTTTWSPTWCPSSPSGRGSPCRGRALARRIVLDPGFGFAKMTAHNWALLRGLDQLLELDHPLLVGTSRKTFLGGWARSRRRPASTAGPRRRDRRDLDARRPAGAGVCGCTTCPRRSTRCGSPPPSARPMTRRTSDSRGSSDRPDRAPGISARATACSTTRSGTDRPSSSTSPARRPRAAGASDDLAETVDYGEVAGDIVALIEGDPLDLIETLAQHRRPGAGPPPSRPSRSRAQAGGAGRPPVRRRPGAGHAGAAVPSSSRWAPTSATRSRPCTTRPSRSTA